MKLSKKKVLFSNSLIASTRLLLLLIVGRGRDDGEGGGKVGAGRGRAARREEGREGEASHLYLLINGPKGVRRR